MRIAVASKDGSVINQHFGHAERFLIYEANGEGVRFIEERPVERYCTGNEAHLYEDSKFEKIYEAIKDCSLLLVSRIGPTPEMELEKAGIKTFMLSDWIDEGIRNILKNVELKIED